MENEKKLYLFSSQDLDHFSTNAKTDEITCIWLRKGANIIEFSDNAEGREAIASKVRSFIGKKAVAALCTQKNTKKDMPKA